jgi:hypothetical protein
MSETTFYLVRYENSGCPESWVGGLYSSKELAQDRVRLLELSGDYEEVWYDEIGLGDFDICNR